MIFPKDYNDFIKNTEDPSLFRNYVIADYDFQNEKYGLNFLLWKIIDNKNKQFNEGRRYIKKELEDLSRQYPSVPHFKNMLAITLKKEGDIQGFFEISNQMLIDFPDYILTRCNIAAEYMQSKELDRAIEFLGEKLDLSELYPERNGQFTEKEIYCYHKIAYLYLLEKEDDLEAQKHLEYLEYLFPTIVESEKLAMHLLSFRTKKMNGRMYEKKLNSRDVKVIPEFVKKTTISPTFTHPEVEIFYHSDYNINKEKLQQIMSLPRETLIQDMEKILIDCIARYDEYADLDWDEETQLFPVHALYVLSALKAEEALPTFFTLLRQSEELLEFWFSDLLTEDFWHFAYLMGEKRLDKLREFILEPNHYVYARHVVATAVVQIFINQEDRKEEVINWFEDIIKYLLDNQDDEKVFDTALFSFLVGDLIDIGSEKQWPLIEQCYATGLVSEFESYPLKYAKEELCQPVSEHIKNEIFTDINQFYYQWKGWVDKPITNKIGNYLKEREPYTPPMPFIAPTKIGRNDPCPCGSGKKYKKCCGKES